MVASCNKLLTSTYFLEYLLTSLFLIVADSTLVNTMRGLEGAGCTDGCILVYSNMHGHSLESERKIVGLNLMMSMKYYK